MLFILCGDDPGQRESVMKMSYVDALLWLQFKKYKGWLMENP